MGKGWPLDLTLDFRKARKAPAEDLRCKVSHMASVYLLCSMGPDPQMNQKGFVKS